MAYIEDVYKDAGIPTYTFVEPNEYTKIIVALRTKGKCLIVEGPSGIGKTTCIIKGLESLGLDNASYKILTPRKQNDKSVIEQLLADNHNKGIIIIDDFHLLAKEIKIGLSDLMKTIADEERIDLKLVLIGINKAGDSLIDLAPDLNNRITTVKFEINPDKKILELIEKGETELNIDIRYKENIVRKANGSFHITQLLCKELCMMENLIQTTTKKKVLTTDVNCVVDKIMIDLTRVFDKKAKEFAVGTRARSGGRAPYLHLLYWLAQSRDWSIRMSEVYTTHPNHKASISQVIDKGFLTKLINGNDSIRSVIHYDEISKILTIEDPKFIFYLQNINWKEFANKIGLSLADCDKEYDFALSFAGEVRSLVAELADVLIYQYDCSVFYDYNEQHKILGEDLTEYFDPIYKSNAEFVVVFLDKYYPNKLWTKFESDIFKVKFGNHTVIPIIFKDCEPTQFDVISNIGYYKYDPDKDQHSQIIEMAELLTKKLAERRGQLF